jgi:phosphoserine phosphatase RsbU/P
MMQRSMVTAPSAIRRIGVIGAYVGEIYTQHVLEGIRDAATGRGASVVCFSGGFIAPDTQGEGGFVYELVRPDIVDAVIIIAANTLRSYEELGGVAKRFASLPVVNVGLASAGVPGVVVDNETGFRRVIEHLIEVHGRRKLAFIGGPSGNADAQIRHGVYCEVLARHGIRIEKDLIAEGRFDAVSGAEAMDAILDRGTPFDGVVAANDATAVGALKALEDRGRRQDDLSVVGFDDDPAAQSAPTPLTTVRQPMLRMGALAVETLFEWSLHGRANPCVVVPTEVVIRQSCGCFFQPEGRASAYGASGPLGARPGKDEFGRLLKRDQLPGHERSAELWNALCADVTDGRPTRFWRVLTDAMLAARAEPDVLFRWQHTLTAMRRMLVADAPDAAGREIGDRLLHEARVIVAEAMNRAFVMREAEKHTRVQAINSFVEQIALAPDLDAIVRLLHHALSHLALGGCQLVLFEGSKDVARLVLSRTGQRATGTRLEPSTPFPTQEVLLEALRASPEPGYALVLALEGTLGPRGFMVFHGSPGDAMHTVPLQVQLAASLRRLEREHGA